MGSARWMGLVLAVIAVGCDDDPEPVDGGMEDDAGAQELPIALEGLDGEVEVIVDDRGMPHIYSTTVHDLAMVQGYLMSRDRFAQMELIRRAVVGRLAEALAGADAGVVDDDRDVRFLGFGRTGRAIYESLSSTDPTRLLAESFVAGINAYIDEVILADDWTPDRGLEVFSIIRGADGFGHWHPADVFALARYQSYNLSYDAGADISRTRARAGVEAAFDPESTDERVRTRAGIYADFWSERQARRVYTREGFNDGSTMAFLPSITRPIVPRPFTVPLATVDGAARYFARLDENPLFHRDPHYGSNSWVVDGTLTESGNPILSNDPHLSLIAPGVWWYVHLNTERMGGEMAIDAQGVAFAGLPGVVLGYNRDIAWSATTTGYDVTDVYLETVTYRNDGTPTAPDWVPVSVAFEGGDVALTTITETIEITGRQAEEFVIFDVPHHGPIIPDSFVEPDVADPATGATAEGTAMSVRYTGHVPTNELAFFTGLLSATSVDDALAAQQHFMVGAQNFSFATRSGDIAWSTRARIPQRSDDACTFAISSEGVVSGTSPLFVLPGDGTAEWEEDLADAFIPHDINPSRHYIATANQDNVGVTDDGNPCNDAHYLGGDFAVGYRQHRIVERLDALAAAESGITVEDMIALQAETRSSLGETMRAPILASIDHALDDPSDDAALDALLTEAGSGAVADLTMVRDRLMAWSLATPHGVGATSADEIADSVATTIFNATITRLTGLAFEDESTAIGQRPGAQEAARMLEWALMSPADQEALPLYTYRDDYLGITGWSDSVLWDDMTTDAIETRDERVTRAVLAAIAWLEGQLGADWDEWRWGRLHAVRFDQVVPPLAGPAVVSIPPEGSTEFPLGFPRHGDYGAVDVGNFGMFGGERFTHGSGASQRLVVEMTPDGPRPFNALPGGQVEDPDSPHHADEAELWRRNEQPPLYFERADVEAHAEETLRFAP